MLEVLSIHVILDYTHVNTILKTLTYMYVTWASWGECFATARSTNAAAFL